MQPLPEAAGNGSTADEVVAEPAGNVSTELGEGPAVPAASAAIPAPDAVVLEAAPAAAAAAGVSLRPASRNNAYLLLKIRDGWDKLSAGRGGAPGV